MTTVVGGCNKIAIAEFWRISNADREPPEVGAEPLPAEATGRLSYACERRRRVGAVAAELVEVIPGGCAAIDFMGGRHCRGGCVLAGIGCRLCDLSGCDARCQGCMWCLG